MSRLRHHLFLDPRLRLGILVSIASLFVGVSIPLFELGQTAISLVSIALIVSIATVYAILVRFAVVEFPEIGWKNPIVIPSLYLFLAYCLRPLYILITRNFGDSPLLNDRKLGDLERLFNETLLVILCASLLFFIGYVVSPRSYLAGILSTDRQLRASSTWLLLIILLISGVAAAIILSELSGSSIGWRRALQARTSLYQGRTHIIVAMSLFRMAFLVWLSFRIGSGRAVSRMKWVAITFLWSVTLVFDMLSGGRADVILYNLIPMFAILAAAFSGTARGKLALPVGLIVSLVVFVAYRTVVRDRVTTENGSTGGQSIVSNVLRSYEYLLGSFEADIFDALVLVMMRVPEDLSYRGLAPTLHMVFTSLIPSGLYSGKPDRTTTVLTEALRPLQASWGGNLAFSGAADLYFSLGIGGLLVGFMLLGAMTGLLMKSSMRVASANPRHPWPLCFAFLVAGDVLMLIRVDLTMLPLAALHLLCVVLVFFVLTVSHVPIVKCSGQN